MKNKLLLLSILIVTLILQFGCKKDGASGPPLINTVRSVDSTKRDSFFVRAFQRLPTDEIESGFATDLEPQL